MNDEIEAGPTTAWSKFIPWITRIGGAAMVIAIVRLFLWAPAEEPEGPHCADAKGNATCVEHYGGNQPYCVRGTTIFRGCMAEPPLPQDAAACGKLEKGLPGDPDCSKIVEDNPPSADVIATREQAKMLNKIPAILGIGFFLVTTIWIYGRVIIRARAQAQHERRAAELAAVAGPKTSETLPPPGHQAPGESKESQP